MSIKEYHELITEINKNHGWNNMMENSDAGRKSVKYITTNFDTREGTDGKNGELWVVQLHVSNILGSRTEIEKTFSEEDCNKETILNYLRTAE